MNQSNKEPFSDIFSWIFIVIMLSAFWPVGLFLLFRKISELKKREKPENPCRARLLRHAQIGPGRILLPVCEAGEEKTMTVTKKDPLWKRARKIRWGERV